MEAMEARGSTPAHGRQIVHGDNWIPADQRSMTTDELGGFLSAQKIDRVVPVQTADQREVMAQDPARYRIPARIDDEDAKPRRARRLVFPRTRSLPDAGRQLDDRPFLYQRRFLRRRFCF